MARARNIKPGLYKNEVLAECSIWARYIFPGLWLLADREGRLEDRPKRIKGELAPYDAVDIDPLLDELAESGFIVRYFANGENYLQITKFTEHQTPHVREAPSTIPSPSSTDLGRAKAVTSTNLGSAKEMPSTDLGSGLTSPRSPDCGLPHPSSLIEVPQQDSPPPKADTKGRRLPPDWELPSPWAEWATAEKPEWSAEDVRQCSLRFADFWHAKAGKDAAKLDWQATWRNWVRTEHGPTNSRPSTRPMGGEAWTPPSIR